VLIRHQSITASLLAAVLLALAGCVQDPVASATPNVMVEREIALPPPPPRALTVGIYNCIDTTGQRRPTLLAQELSTAVPMDCTPYLVEAIRSLRPGYIFLVERQHIDELLRERQLATLALNVPAQPVAAQPPTTQHRGARHAAAELVAAQQPAAPRRLTMVRVAEVLLIGQVVAYDRATRDMSGGLAFAGIGVTGTLVTDLVTFSLRAIAVQTGEVIGPTTVTKSITAMKAGGHVTKIPTASVFELELGGAGNEPVGLALRAAIRSALDQLVQNGIHDGWWV
jgi:curli biogenesis system outer membrane secretion channel CsgG